MIPDSEKRLAQAIADLQDLVVRLLIPYPLPPGPAPTTYETKRSAN